MKKSLLYLPIILGIIILISVPSVTAQSESNTIPSWIKGVANFWIDGGINDAEFIEALEFLIDNNVIKLGESIVVNNTMSVITTEQKDILDLTISQKEDRIKILENEINTLNNKISSMPVIPSESEMIINLNRQIETLNDKLDQENDMKDTMEEDLRNDITKLNQMNQDQVEKFQKDLADLREANTLLQIKYDAVVNELETLKQN